MKIKINEIFGPLAYGHLQRMITDALTGDPDARQSLVESHGRKTHAAILAEIFDRLDEFTRRSEGLEIERRLALSETAKIAASTHDIRGVLITLMQKTREAIDLAEGNEDAQKAFQPIREAAQTILMHGLEGTGDRLIGSYLQRIETLKRERQADEEKLALISAFAKFAQDVSSSPGMDQKIQDEALTLLLALSIARKNS